MQLRWLFRALVVVLVVAGVSPSRTSAETLADVLVAAYRHSNLLDQNRALLRATDEDLVQAYGALLPVINFVTQAQFTENSNALVTDTRRVSFALNADFTLFDFGRGRLAIDAAREQVLATRAALVGVEQGVLLRAVQAYLGVISARDTVALRRNNLALIQQELRAARERFELGDSTRTDVAIAEARLAGSQSALAAAEGDFAVAREDFNLAIGRYPNSLSQPPRLPRLPSSLAAAQETGRRNHPAILQAQHQVAALDLGLQSARTQRLGSVTGSLGASVSDSSGVGNTQLSGSVSWAVPLYRGGRLNSAERQALARQEAQRAGLHQTVAQVQQAVAANWAQLSVARARLEAGELQIRAASTAYDAVRAEAELGSRTTLDVLNAEQELLDARSNQIVALASVQLASYALLESMGQLTVQSLNLGIPTYDVEAYANGLRESGHRVPSVQGQRLDSIMGRYQSLQ